MVLSETNARIRSVDTVRGLIMVIMALDHVRDFFHVGAFTSNPLEPAATTPELFFTRWITHFCAPSFMLLSGISAFLAGQRRSTSETASFLIKRGLWLIVAEIVFMTFAFSFDPAYKTIYLAVLWALGTSMLLLGIAVRFFSARTILIIGLLIVFSHNLLDYVKVPQGSMADVLLGIFLTGAGRFIPLGNGAAVAFLYVILPWTGIMLSGYGLGQVYKPGMYAPARRRLLLTLGIFMLLLFLVLRYLNVYGDPVPWTHQTGWQRTLFSFLNVSKYPPSLLFTLLTLGPALVALALTEQLENGITRFFTVYGKVPFFYFMLHFYLIHLMTMVAVLSSGYTWEQATDDQLFFKFRPFDFGYGLGVVYLIWIFVVAVLYFPCKWFGAYRARTRKWWLSYL
ncbi:DUF1624 domain-containing protein [Dyadobacter sandarakinus]|uniref:DUF1624 domain-containing protein n=1 Tax=Dyadobacter sandarakinus TaxID=2747268 RepID=A0ABX7I4Y7_9BACT|nr:heparan-alpha-glucosaminide N-acetyltransferase domain-containing protein [Dyadobacter sandarakinus]QRR01174.1 DUF1624 domain-containing protein [Dyadobacter sandarakinus]